MSPADYIVEVTESPDDCDDSIKNNQQKQDDANNETKHDGHKAKNKSRSTDSNYDFMPIVMLIGVILLFLYFMFGVWFLVDKGKYFAR